MNEAEPIRVVSAKDPALDLAEMDLRRYVETRDASHLRLVPGVRPVWYTLRPLNIYDVEAASSLPQAMQARACFETAIEAIDGCEALGGDGAWRPRKVVEDALGKKRPVPTRAEMQHLFQMLPHGLDTMQELGAIAYERATLGNGFRGAPTYTVPPLFSPELARNVRLRAERSQARSETPSSEHSSSP